MNRFQTRQKGKVKQTQSVVLSPQVKQAISLLQFSNVELSNYVEDQIQQNPLLEKVIGEVTLDGPEGNVDTGKEDKESRSLTEKGPVTSNDTIRRNSNSQLSSHNQKDQNTWVERVKQEVSLQDFLRQQLNMAVNGQVNLDIGEALIGTLDDSGYISSDLRHIEEDTRASSETVRKVLNILKTFEPTGVFAQSLEECLTLQLNEKGLMDEAMQGILTNLEFVAKYDISQLKRKTNLCEEDVINRIRILKSLDPKPGSSFYADVSPSIVPDVFIYKNSSQNWIVELNSETLPKVLVNKTYLTEITELGENKECKSFVEDMESHANWLIQALDNRAKTILKVSQEIFLHQTAFFEKGPEFMLPLILQQMADKVSMHKSTISRVVNNKFVQTPSGVFELKHFFSPRVPSISAESLNCVYSVQRKIKRMVESETSEEILTDDDLMNMLRGQDISVARRTVAKYREDLGIPSAPERRRRLKFSKFVH